MYVAIRFIRLPLNFGQPANVTKMSKVLNTAFTFHEAAYWQHNVLGIPCPLSHACLCQSSITIYTPYLIKNHFTLKPYNVSHPHAV